MSTTSKFLILVKTPYLRFFMDRANTLRIVINRLFSELSHGGMNQFSK